MTASIWAPNGFSPEIVPFAFYEGTALAGQTVISIAPYTAILDSQLQVFVAGELQNTNLWTVSGTTVVLDSPMSAGQSYRVDIYAAAPVVEKELPSQTGHENEVLKTDGTLPFWAFVKASEVLVDPLIPIYPGAGTVQDVLEAVADSTEGGFLYPPTYGAVGDGVTDDTIAIQATLNLGKKVWFGDHTKNYRITQELVLQDDQIIFGGGARIFQDSYQTPIFNVVGKSRVTISHLKLTGKQMVTVAAGSFVVGQKYSIITTGTTNFIAIGAASNAPGTHFIATGSGAGTGVGSTFYNRPTSLDIGIRGQNTSSLSVHFCTFDRFAYSPLMISSGGNNIKFCGNTVTGPGAGTLNPLGGDPANPGFRNCTGVTVIGSVIDIADNVISNVSQGLIVGQGSSSVTVVKNKISNTVVEHGMYIDTGVVDTVVAHNELKNCTLNGIKFQWYDSYGATPKNLVIADNVVNGALGGDGIVVLNSEVQTIATISGITNANPGVISTNSAHGLVVGDKILISDIVGMTPLNDMFFVNSVPTTTSFTVRTSGSVIDTSNIVTYPAWISGGNIAKPRFLSNLTISGNVVNDCLQEGISTRFVDMAVISSNVVNVAGRFGYGQLYCVATDVKSNRIRSTQYNGIFAQSPLTPCDFTGNTLTDVGLAGDDTAGGSSGILVFGDGGGSVEDNTVAGERTQVKMRYGIQLASGVKTQWSIRDNLVLDARDATMAVHALTNDSLRLFGGNTGTSAAGPDAIVGLTQMLPARGNPQEYYYGTAAPTTGTWPQGSKVFALYPGVATTEGWECTVNGTPGTWNPFGIVHKVAATQALQGDYTPTVAAVAGITGGVGGVTLGSGIYSVHGGHCTVRGRFLANVTAGNTTITVELTLPISATLGTSGDSLYGMVVGGSAGITSSGRATNNGVNNNVHMFIYVVATAGVQNFCYEFTYKL